MAANPGWSGGQPRWYLHYRDEEGAEQPPLEITDDVYEGEVRFGAQYDYKDGRFRHLTAQGHLVVDNKAGHWGLRGGLLDPDLLTAPIGCSLVSAGGTLLWYGAAVVTPAPVVSPSTLIRWELRSWISSAMPRKLSWRQAGSPFNAVIKVESVVDLFNQLGEAASESVALCPGQEWKDPDSAEVDDDADPEMVGVGWANATMGQALNELAFAGGGLVYESRRGELGWKFIADAWDIQNRTFSEVTHESQDETVLPLSPSWAPWAMVATETTEIIDPASAKTTFGTITLASLGAGETAVGYVDIPFPQDAFDVVIDTISGPTGATTTVAAVDMPTGLGIQVQVTIEATTALTNIAIPVTARFKRYGALKQELLKDPDLAGQEHVLLVPPKWSEDLGKQKAKLEWHAGWIAGQVILPTFSWLLVGANGEPPVVDPGHLISAKISATEWVPFMALGITYQTSRDRSPMVMVDGIGLGRTTGQPGLPIQSDPYNIGKPTVLAAGSKPVFRAPVCPPGSTGPTAPARPQVADFSVDATVGHATGIWGNATTIWVGDSTVEHSGNVGITAYRKFSGARDASKDRGVVQIGASVACGAMWSDGTTLYWVSSGGVASTPLFRRTTSTVFLAPSGLSHSYAISGIWSDGTTMWLLMGRTFTASSARQGREILWAYDMSTKARAPDKDIIHDEVAVDPANMGARARGIWSDGTTMWMLRRRPTEGVNFAVWAYSMADGSRDTSKDISDLSADGMNGPQDIWSDGTILYVANTGGTGIRTQNKVFAFRLDGGAHETGEPPNPPTGLTLTDPKDSSLLASWTAPASGSAVDYYEVVWAAGDVAAGTDSGTVEATEAVKYRVDGLNVETEYTVSVRAVNISGGSTWIKATGTTAAAPPAASATDIDTLFAARTRQVNDLWSDGTTVWFSDSGSSLDAYNLASHRRDSSKDISTLYDGGNRDPWGIWSDGTTLWVGDTRQTRIYAYDWATKARDSGKDFTTLSRAGNGNPAGLWSDGTTMWVADAADGKIYAYNVSTKARDSGKDFNTLTTAGNTVPTGIWSDGTTMWVADATDDKIYAYNLSTKARDSGKDFDTLAARQNRAPAGIWSDGNTMYVVDFTLGKAFAYDMSTKAARGSSVPPPGVPTAVKAVPKKTSIKFNWGRPADGGAVRVYEYAWAEGHVAAGAATGGSEVITARVVNFTGLPRRTDYTLSVRAIGPGGASAWVSVQTATT